jgi:hypothetical protein
MEDMNLPPDLKEFYEQEQKEREDRRE